MSKSIAYLRTEDAPRLAPPLAHVGWRKWIWDNVFSSMSNFNSIGASISSIAIIAFSVVLLIFGLNVIWSLINFAIIDAVWSDPDTLKRGICSSATQGGVAEGTVGACWPFIAAKGKLIIYGRYPEAELWRVNILFIGLAVGIAWLIWEKAPFRRQVGFGMLTLFPLLAFILLTGGGVDYSSGTWITMTVLTVLFFGGGLLAARNLIGEVLFALSGFLMVFGLFLLAVLIAMFVTSINFGLEHVETANWGGLLVTLVVAITGIVASLPLGIALALGRRSKLPLIRYLSVGFIEFWRGVPLISVLFMSSVMLPLFLPEGMEFDKLLRALIGVALFSAAYMAEVVRGGLQAIPKGQYEGAMALGLSYPQMTRLIILPQALKIVIPGIVNTFISLFKDTTLVLIIGLFDLLGTIQSAFTDASWTTPVTSATGYLVAAFIFWAFCFAMSRYSIHLENKLETGHRN